MAFKKGGKSKKKVVKKSKGKSKKTDEWGFEGGVAIENKEDKNALDIKAIKRSSNQDRDERLRRSRMKIADRKLKNDFVKKMAKKLSFSEYLLSEQGQENDNDEIETAPIRKEYKINPSSKLSVFDRLQNFVMKSLSEDSLSLINTHHKRKIESTKSTNDDTVNDNIVVSKNKKNSKLKESEIGNISSSIQSNKPYSVIDELDEKLLTIGEEEDNDDDINYQNISEESFIFDWFFNSTDNNNNSSISENNNEENNIKLKLKYINKVNNNKNDLYGSINDCIPKDKYDFKLSSFLSLPGLHKLWSSSNNLRQFDHNNNKVGMELLPYIATYADLFIDGRNQWNDKDYLNTILFHAITHTVKARAKVLKHNQKIKQKLKDSVFQTVTNEIDNNNNNNNNKNSKKRKNKDNKQLITSDLISSLEDNNDNHIRDQGFTRPRVLILCPFRGSAKSIIDEIINILGVNTSVAGMDKLEQEYSYDSDDNSDEDNNINNELNRNKYIKTKDNKPDDWKHIFKQNVDDDFKIGIQVNPGHGKGTGTEKGVYVRLFSDFFISDIIIASPIGLRLCIENNQKEKGSYDFLSSLEIVILHQTDVLFMQNWDHVEFILKHTNQLPLNSHTETDFSRVRPYFLDNKSIMHRQLILTSSFNDPDIQNIFRNYAKSISGCLMLKNVKSNDGEISKVFSNNLKQVFQLIPNVKDFINQDDVRFQYFKENILSRIIRTNQSHTLIVTPSYIHYIRVRNELIHQEANAAFVCEYSRDSEISRGRSRFYHGQKDILLYSGRAHFFRRFVLRGARHIVFYSLPQYEEFYSELVNMLSNDDHSSNSDNVATYSELTCTVLFTQYERMALERIVGKKRCDYIFSSKKMTFMFC